MPIALKPYATLWLTIFFTVFIRSAINPKNYPTWVLEIAPTLIAVIALAITRNT